MTAGGNIWKEWLPAVMLSLAVNGLMFGALPGLLDRPANTPLERVPIHPINFIRLKQETPPVRRDPPPPEKRKPTQAKTINPKVNQPPKLPALAIPFEPDRFLPVTPGAITIPLARGVIFDNNPSNHEWGIGDLDQPLTPLVRIPPIYPARAKRQGIEGWVRVKFLVQQNGRVTRVEILEAVPENLFDKSVLRCVRQWRFKPGTVDGEPVDVRAETVIRFKLK